MSFLPPAAAVVMFLGPAAALIAPRLRRPVALLLLLTAAALAVALAQNWGESAELEVTHSFAAYVESDVESVAFVVDEVTAAAWQWPALSIAWCLGWLAWGLLRRGGGTGLVTPLVLAWGGSALLLLLQKAAAPAPLAMGLELQPLPPFEIVLWPAILAAVIRLARASDKVLPLLMYMVLVTALAHLPLAIFGTLATRHELGTYLDVHRIDFVANPINQMPTELAAGSSQQLTWLIWLPQLIVWPAFTMLSAGSVGFASLMLKLQRRENARR